VLTVIQRVSRAAVRVDGEVVGAVERGAMLLVAVERGDVEADAVATAKKIASLRFFPGATPMDRTLAEVGGGVLVVSQFTLAGSLRKGRRPSFDGAELPERARALYEAVAAALRAEGLEVATGRFAAHMEVDLVNDGPVTFLLRSVAGQVQ
jgi:D-tyrosyl-tRNA(Tyr) deacylase